MPSTPPKPHDALVRYTFSNPAYAADALRAALPASLAARIRWDTLTLQEGSFVDQSLCAAESDLLFMATFGERSALIYLLFEHQSTVDKLMALRVLAYVVQVLQQFARNHPGQPLPVIIPVVLHHSATGWTAPTQLASLFGDALVDCPELSGWLPSFRFVLDDISRASDTELRRHATEAFPSLVLWALRDARNEQALLSNLRHWAEALDRVARAPSGKDALVALFRYISEVAEVPVIDLQEAVRAAAPRAEDAVMTLAEQLLRKGRAEGRAEGQREMLRDFLTAKFGPLPEAYAARLEAATGAELDELRRRVFTADGLEALFGR